MRRAGAYSALIKRSDFSQSHEKMTENFFKLLTPIEWEQFQLNKEFHGTLMDIRDGYIHMSETASQMTRVKEKYYKDQKMFLLRIDSSKLSNVKFEPASNGDLYPHQYGVLPFESVVSVQEIC